MHLMVMMRNAGINLRGAGDTEFRELRVTSFINSKTLGRLGFKKDITRWDVTSKKTASSRFTAESHPQMQAETGHGAGEEGAAESSMPQPHTPKPKFQDTSTQIPHLTNLIQSLQATISSDLAHFTSHINEKIDYLAATVHSRLESMDSKLDDLTIRVKHCESQLSQPHSTPSPSPSQPQQPSSHPQPTPTHSAGSPLFTMEELTTVQPTQPQPSSTPSQPQPAPQAPTQPQASSPQAIHSSESTHSDPNLPIPSPSPIPTTTPDPSTTQLIIPAPPIIPTTQPAPPSSRPKSPSSTSSSSFSPSSPSPIRPIPSISTLPTDTPTLTLPQPPAIPTHTSPTQPSPSSPSGSEKTLAEEFVKTHLQIPKRTRTKQCAVKTTSKFAPRK